MCLSLTFLIAFFTLSVREMLTFFSKTIAKRTPLGQRQSVQNEGIMNYSLILSISVHVLTEINVAFSCMYLNTIEYYVHVYMRTDGLCGCITCDAEYPPRVAFSLLTRLLEDFSTFKPDWTTETRNEAVQWPQLETDVVKYQDPANADQIMKIQRSLDETRDVLHNTIGK